MNGHLEGEQPYLGDLLTMVINHLLNGMIIQVRFWRVLFFCSPSQMFLGTWIAERFFAAKKMALDQLQPFSAHNKMTRATKTVSQWLIAGLGPGGLGF